MNDVVKKPKWYVRYGLECYDVIKYLIHKLSPIEAVHMANHTKYAARFLEKHEEPKLQEQDLDKANETWNSFYLEAKKRFVPKGPMITPDEWIEDPLHDED
jgi:hypothetical protein